ncbi:rhamnogalacturonan acetylesterase [Filimonas effusa]|nr:rhamnogalacturonan acetylesterase [Filimonas effusa]
MNRLLIVLPLLLLLSAFIIDSKRPVIYVVGDSTVQNSDGNGTNEYWGWGTLLKAHLDTTRISLHNHAKAGTSTRTFMSDGRWDKVLAQLKPGDFVLIQFGHNDQAAINDSARAKGTLKGIGEDTVHIFNLKTRQPEIVHTYGWYLNKYIKEAKEKGAIPIVCSLVPRNKWKGDKVDREIEYVNWAEEVTKASGTFFINLNQLIVNQWEQQGKDAIKKFFPVDGTHTNLAGATENANAVAEGLAALKDCPLKGYLK